jgi:type II secretory pathway component GspD/PulD (secretin)
VRTTDAIYKRENRNNTVLHKFSGTMLRVTSQAPKDSQILNLFLETVTVCFPRSLLSPAFFPGPTHS